jgi:hypothetical protein
MEKKRRSKAAISPKTMCESGLESTKTDTATICR